MRRQKGLSLSGFLLWGVLVLIVVMLGLKIGPPYLEYLSIQKQFKAVASDPGMQSATPHAIGGAFSMRAAVENITSIGPQDLEITKDGDRLVISASYTVCVPIVANLKACMDFAPSSAQ